VAAAYKRVVCPGWFFGIILMVAGTGWADWPQFRGPSGDGLATAPDSGERLGVTVRWSETENVVWKTAIPHLGWSSPVVMDGQVWLTTATEEGHDFFAICVDAESGAIRFNERVFHAETPEPLGNPLNGYASPTPVIERGRVYVHFGSYGTACLDAGTFEVLWKREDLRCRHYRGPGSSPILFEDLLILTMDGVDVQYLVALEKATGPVYQDGVAYMISGFGRTELMAIRVEGSGDVTDSHVLWKTARTVPRTPSPVLIGDLLFTINDTGIVVCLDAATGEQIWKDRIRGDHAASLLYADGNIYSFNQDGSSTVFRAARRFEVVATNMLNAGCMATPAFDGDALLIRTKTHLYRIEGRGGD
jgi:outer membrane protein assembly factor BamB